MAAVAETLKDSDRVNDGRPDSHHQPRCAQIYGTAEVKTDKLDPGGGGGGGRSFILNHHPCLGILQQHRLQDALTAEPP